MFRPGQFSALCAAVLVSTIGASFAKSAPESDVVAAVPGAKQLIDKLSDPAFVVREAATSQLWEMGEKVRPQLEEVAKTNNPEAVTRANELIRKLDLFLRPDSDPKLVDLVERYQTASAKERKSLFQRIRALRAWPQLLRLYANEDDPYIRTTYATSMYSIAAQSAREQIWKGNDQVALELLRLAPDDQRGLNSLASFYWSRGTLQDELKKVRDGKGKKPAEWRLALARAAGDLPTAAHEAELAENSLMSAAMTALNGDPVPWLLMAPDLKRNESNDLFPLYAELARERWSGHELDDVLLREVSGKLVSSSIRQKGLAMNTLFLLNQTQLAEPSFEKATRLNAYRHYLALERVDDALRVLGLDAEVAKNKAWVSKRIDSLHSENLNLEEGYVSSALSEELMVYASFLDSRGLSDEGYELYAPGLLKIGKKHKGVLIAVLGELLDTGGAPSMAIRIAEQWAGDQEELWDGLRAELFQDNELAESWWKWLGELKPKASLAERMRGLLSLYRVGPDPKRIRDAWIKLAWEDCERRDGEAAKESLSRIASLEAAVGDVKGSLKAWDAEKTDADTTVFWAQGVLQLSAANRWNEAADTILKAMDEMNDDGNVASPELHAYAASSLRKAGRIKEAVKHDEWVNKLSLGQSDTMVRIANGYAYGADYERASKWWERAAIMADPKDDSFASFVSLHGEALLLSSDWKKAASIMEMVTAIHAETNYRMQFPLTFMHQRLKADVCRALSQLDDNRESSIELLRHCHQVYKTDGALADFFYPALREVGLTKYHDEWFKETWDHMHGVLQRYPNSYNTCNTLAWFGARSQRKLDDSEKYLKKALDNFPYQPAYLDTMAEIQFARGKRSEALRWSDIAINYSPGEAELRRQQYHFRVDPMPR